MFYYKTCTRQQLQLLNRLIDYRVNTTDEERRSEKALIATLCQDYIQSAIYINKIEEYIDGRQFQICEPLEQLKAKGLTNKKILTEKINDWSRLLEIGLEEQFEGSFPELLIYADKVLALSTTLPKQYSEEIVSDLYVFCLGQYIAMRAKDTSKGSFFSLSGEQKCAAAQKMQRLEKGEPVKLGVYDNIAIREGRLKTLVSKFEDFRLNSLNQSPTV